MANLPRAIERIGMISTYRPRLGFEALQGVQAVPRYVEMRGDVDAVVEAAGSFKAGARPAIGAAG